MKILGELFARDALKIEDEYEAALYADALWALYNSYYYGKDPRMKKGVVQVDVFKELEVRPSVYQPESLFGEEGEFLIKTWQSRLRPLKRLFETAPQRR